VVVPEKNREAFGLGNEAQPASRASELNWRHSSMCGTHGSCVEIADTADGGMAIRDGKSADSGPVLFFNREEWDAFVAGVRAGEFG
jgi:hypothetical protein